MIPRRSVLGAGWYYFWLEDTLQTKQKGKVRGCVRPAQPAAPAASDVAICGSQAAVSAGVCDTARLHSAVNPLSQCAVAYVAVQPGCGGDIAIGCTFNLKIKEEEEETMNTPRMIHRSEVTSITVF